ncbi:hypothetical protein [Peterkaempfera bronchialis]|uniref:hypothetical protein n=1 Tax=Peterkaempfera bronchialis TaxID=2126346 RepID=UPI003C2B13A4
MPPPQAPPPPPGARAPGLRWLAAVAAAFTAAQLALVVPGTGLGWDETIYVSQVYPRVPAAFFSAPRARGISYLVAPMAALTSATPVLRICLALLSGCALFATLAVWRRLLPTRVLALAGVLFAGLWITLFYGPAAMPNLWSAFGALAAVGCCLRAVHDRADRWALPGLAAGTALVALMRPPDAGWLVLPLAAAALLLPGRRRPAVLLALAAGLVVGGAEWVVEAQLHYGGVLARLGRASEIEGGMGAQLALGDQLRALDGRTLCRPCTGPWRHRATAAWWFALPLCAAGGLLAARSARRSASAVLPAATAVCMAVPYLFGIDYAAPRFLLPSYALLALPVADFLLWAPTRLPGRLRPAAAALVTAALVGHLAVQQSVLAGAVAATRDSTGDYARLAAALHRLGVRPPCLLTGDHAVPVAYYTGCASRQTSGHDATTTPAGIQAATRRRPVAVLVAGGSGPPVYARDWRPEPVPGLRSMRGQRIFLPPAFPGRRTPPGQQAQAGSVTGQSPGT